ncbi:MAG: phosphoglucosamine mutase [Holosporaceae bacterium]|nr:phosphoglucosamine mutase [Holosporaceae bacterium]
MRKLFGTDGIRGVANEYPLTIDLCKKLAEAITLKYCETREKKHTVIIGKDPRLSGDMFEHALAAAFCSCGINVKLLGVVPTPAVSILTHNAKASMGIMVSASHNLFYDNGIKLFNKFGLKLKDDEEAELEEIMEKKLPYCKAIKSDLGQVEYTPSALDTYCTRVRSSFGFRGMGKIVVDSANGSFSHIAPDILKEFGFEVISIHDSPNGININENCGATNPSILSEAVLYHKADLGIAFDGDGDRVILADKNGKFLDGDHILAILAQSCESSEVVSTIMSNCSLEKYLSSINVRLVRTNVGDRYISDYMHHSDARFGAELSGHIIIKSHAPTGDGLFAALKVLEYLSQTPEVHPRLHFFESYPTVSRNLCVLDKSVIHTPLLQSTIRKFEKQLGSCGKLVVRASGTESVIRILAEGQDQLELEQIVNELSQIIIQTSPQSCENLPGKN